MSEYKIVVPLINGQGNLTTNKIKGLIDCFIIDAPLKSEILIQSEAGYVIYHNKSLSGIIYVPVRKECQSPNAQQLNFVADKFNINEKLSISVVAGVRVRMFGQVDSQEVKVLIRTDG